MYLDMIIPQLDIYLIGVEIFVYFLDNLNGHINVSLEVFVILMFGILIII